MVGTGEAESSSLGKGERTRAGILEATIALIAREGFDAVTYDRIGSKVGLTRQLVQKYFPSRDRLLMAAFERSARLLVSMIEAKLAEPCDARRRLERYVEVHFDWLAREPEGAKTRVAFLALSCAHAGARKESTRLGRGGRDRIARLISEIELNGLLPGRRKLKPSERSAHVLRIQSLITGYVLLALTDSEVDISAVRGLAVRQALEGL